MLRYTIMMRKECNLEPSEIETIAGQLWNECNRCAWILIRRWKNKTKSCSHHSISGPCYCTLIFTQLCLLVYGKNVIISMRVILLVMSALCWQRCRMIRSDRTWNRHYLCEHNILIVHNTNVERGVVWNHTGGNYINSFSIGWLVCCDHNANSAFPCDWSLSANVHK